MKYKLLAKNLSTKYSNYIHNMFSNNDYESLNVDDKQFSKILKEKNFKGLNITMPYKNRVCDFLDYKDEIVSKINVCNTVVNINNKLYGYNTDYHGFYNLLKHYNIKVKNKNVLILGNKATASTVNLVLTDLKASNITMLSHQDMDNLNDHLNNSYDVIINTTPVNSNINIDKSLLKDNIIAIDVNFNKQQTNIFKGFKNYYNGLYMLVYQAYLSEILFNNITYDKKLLNNVYVNSLLFFRNIVFIGMPYTGKTSIANYLSTITNKKAFDSDKVFEDNTRLKIRDYLNDNTLDKFREVEHSIINNLLNQNNTIILSTGGGVVTNIDNLDIIKDNSIVILLTRKLSKITLDNTRPLIKNKDDYKKVYELRKKMYDTFKNIEVSNNKSINYAIMTMLKKMRCL